jgi:hypothetical protein
MPLHICLDTESPITTVHSATKQLTLMLKHVSIQVIFPFIAEGAVFEWANEESLLNEREGGNLVEASQVVIPTCY